jgi:hypothetical protein
VTDAQFAWRISAAARQLRALLDKRDLGQWTWHTTDDLWRVERRITQLVNEAQLAALQAALPKEEKVCDGSR